MPAYEWDRGVADIVNAAIGAGLMIEVLREYKEGFFHAFPQMTKGEDGLFRLPPEQAKFPLTLGMRAKKI